MAPPPLLQFKRICKITGIFRDICIIYTQNRDIQRYMYMSIVQGYSGIYVNYTVQGFSKYINIYREQGYSTIICTYTQYWKIQGCILYVYVCTVYTVQEYSEIYVQCKIHSRGIIGNLCISTTGIIRNCSNNFEKN